MRADADVQRNAVVVDASALIAFVASTAAQARRVGARLDGAIACHGPAILPAEIDSGLRGLERGGKLTLAQASAARKSASELPIELWPWELVTERAWELRANLTTYDAGYVALAERLGAPLITGDARLARAAGIRCTVEVFG